MAHFAGIHMINYILIGTSIHVYCSINYSMICNFHTKKENQQMSFLHLMERKLMKPICSRYGAHYEQLLFNTILTNLYNNDKYWSLI